MQENDEEYLKKLGYKQELKRELTSFSNFAVSFSIISILTGINSLFLNGLLYGGPVVLVWGWIVVFLFSFMVALSMAEICSSLPTSGALYYWSAQLAPKHAALSSWITGWLNLIGQVATTASINFGLGTLILNLIASQNPNLVVLIWHNFVIFILILLLQAIINVFGTKLLRYCADISAWWHMIGIVVIVVALIIFVPEKKSISFIFTKYNYDPTTGIESPIYIFMIGLLTAQFTFTGFDASAHMSEETKNASLAGPIGIVTSVLFSFLFGLIYIIGLLIATPDIETVIKQGGLIVIFLNAVGPKGAFAFSIIIIGAMFFCGLASLTSNSRMIYAFSRDGAIPFSSIWHKIDSKTKAPMNSVWLSVFLALVLTLPCLSVANQPLSKGNPVAFTAVTSVSVIGLYISYVIPVFLRNTIGKETFVPGPFHLGSFSSVVGWISIFWVIFICIIFVLPTSYPNSLNESFSWITNMNYSGPMIIICTLLFMGWYYIDAKKWFKGPKVANLKETP